MLPQRQWAEANLTEANPAEANLTEANPTEANPTEPIRESGLNVHSLLKSHIPASPAFQLIIISKTA